MLQVCDGALHYSELSFELADGVMWPVRDLVCLAVTASHGAMTLATAGGRRTRGV